MSKEQLVDAYLHGDLTRRRFIQRLVAAGVSVSAAVAYAQISPELAEAKPGKGKARGHYDHYNNGRRRRGGRDCDPH